MNLFLYRIYRSPLVAEAAGGTAVSESYETAAASGADEAQSRTAEAQESKPKSKTEPDAKADEQGEKPTGKQEPSDWEAYQKMQAKYERNPNARPTKREVALQAKYDGKDEKTIAGWTAQDKPQDSDEGPAAETLEKESPAAAPVPKELESLIGEKSPIGAKTLADLPAKVKAMSDKMAKMNGDFGAVGRVLQEAGVENIGQLREEIKGAHALHKIVAAAKRGDQQALSSLGIQIPNGQGRGQEQSKLGETPDGILDEALYGHISPQLKAANEKIEKLERALNDRFGDVDAWKKDNEKRNAANARTTQMSEVINEVATLAQSVGDIWDAKKYGSVNAALKEYYETPDGAEYNPGLKHILEILEIAKKNRIEDLGIAHAYWERKNRGSIALRAREEARQPFTGKAASVGLSDQQQNHSGQFKEYTRQQVTHMGQKGYPAIPSEWVDNSGTLIESKVPAYARSWLFGDNEE